MEHHVEDIGQQRRRTRVIVYAIIYTLTHLIPCAAAFPFFFDRFLISPSPFDPDGEMKMAIIAYTMRRSILRMMREEYDLNVSSPVESTCS